ncbi:hypothetical protein D3C73_925140 [compost metagenome]
MMDSGFSCASNTFCCNAEYSSPKASGAGLAPSAVKVSRRILSGVTRVFRPARSAGLAMAPRLLVTWRKPFSHQEMMVRFFLSASLASAVPSSPSKAL